MSLTNQETITSKWHHLKTYQNSCTFQKIEWWEHGASDSINERLDEFQREATSCVINLFKQNKGW